MTGFTSSRQTPRPIASPALGNVVAQPTWSRDGSLVVVSSQTRGQWEVAIVDGSNGEIVSRSDAVRPYFFFSWSSDGTHIAALGPGQTGTTLDLLDSEGGLIDEAVVTGGSVYVAWEPDGTDLLVHTGDDMLLVRPDGAVMPMGVVGRFFLAPTWIPGTRDVLVVTGLPNRPHLARYSVDALTADPNSEPTADFGTTDGVTSVVVNSSGRIAALLHARPGASPEQGGDATIAFAVDRPDQEPTAAVEVVELSSGDRTAVSNQAPLWGEWSRDGHHLLLATFDPDSRQGVWSAWDGDTLTKLTSFLPTSSFLQRYLVFADQYVEQPRLWSPDGSAFTYAARDSDNRDAVYVMSLDPAISPIQLDSAAVGFWSPR